MENNDKKLLENAIRLKGYGSDLNKDSSDKKRLEKSVRVDNELTVKPTVITCLKEYIEFIGKIEYSYKNPVFYRGQGNANYTISPGSLRKNPANEKIMLESFERRFSTEVDSCTTNMARLVLMQHFGMSTRALDVTENPLAALYFACSPMKKFNKNPEAEKKNWGEITIFRDPDFEEKETENQKQIDSNKVSIISSTAFMKNEFNLWKLGMKWKKDNNFMHDEKHIQLKEIIRSSVIVRVPQNNQRIKNQQGAFILVNANEVSSLANDERYAEELTNHILNYDGDLSFNELMNDKKWSRQFSEGFTWSLRFKKVKPYSGENRIKIFDIDPFDLRRLFYKDEEGIQQVVLIPPDKKEGIVNELKKFNITEDFIYPDMDNVANEINENINI